MIYFVNMDNIQISRHIPVSLSQSSGDAWGQGVVFQWFPGPGHRDPRGPSVDSGRCISDTVLQCLRQRTGPGRLCACEALNPTITHQ